MLRRVGNKSKLAHKITAHFPKHEIFIDMFCGALGLFLNKPKARYNFLNDYDNDVFNFWSVLKADRELLKSRLAETPYCEAIFKFWLQNRESDPVWSAVRFIYLSNYSFLGKGDLPMRFDSGNPKTLALASLEKTAEMIMDCQFLNKDFRDVLKSIGTRDGKDVKKTFLYCDPPYLGTTDNYSNSFTEQDTIDLFEICVSSNLRFAISEFANPFILELANKHGLNIIEIGERRALENRNKEILITNYEQRQTGFFG